MVTNSNTNPLRGGEQGQMLLGGSVLWGGCEVFLQPVSSALPTVLGAIPIAWSVLSAVTR